MSNDTTLLRCRHCKQAISAMDKRCPQCGRALFFMADMKERIEGSPLWLAAAVIGIVLFLGVAWFVRMDTGMRWPLYVVLICAAPAVPWLLQLAYKAASPLPNDKADTHTRPDA